MYLSAAHLVAESCHLARCITGMWSPWWIAASVLIVIIIGATLIRLVISADADRRARLRDAGAALVQHILLFGFAAVAAAISAHGLIGFARASMGLRGAWPFLLWAALDGAAGLCAVLLIRRAARGESALAPRLAVWGLVTASSAFNWTHAPHHPGAREAFAIMPVIAATLFEFSLRETRHTAERSERRLTGLQWLRPLERVRVQLELAADQALSTSAAVRRVQVRQAAWSLHRLRRALGGHADAGQEPASRSRLARRAERRAQVALTRTGFADPAVADEVLRHAWILNQTVTLARLDHAEDGPAHGKLAFLSAYPQLRRQAASRNGADRAISAAGTSMNGHSSRHQPQSTDRLLVDAASEVVTQARQQGIRLSQSALARELRAQGLSIANGRLHWLAATSGLNHDLDQQ